MLAKLESTLREECRLDRERLIVVGVSGGPDSLCLMHVLQDAGYHVLAAHFNHHLRSEADQETLHVRQIAAQLKLELVIGEGDVRAHARLKNQSIEEAARVMRYDFLFKLAQERDAQAVAVGHSADDQVETILMHFLRGSGLTGLKGMRPRAIIPSLHTDIPLIRPLLGIRREETVEYCAAHDLVPCHDLSNEDVAYRRNHIRHVLIPALEHYNPKVREAILRMSRVLNGDYDFMIESVNKAWDDVVVEAGSGYFAFDVPLLSDYPPGLKRNLIRKAVQALCPDMDPGAVAIGRAVDFIDHPQPAGHLELGEGMRILLEGGKIYICRLDAEWMHNLWPQLNGVEILSVVVPGETNLSSGWVFAAELLPVDDRIRKLASQNRDRFHTWLDADTLPSVMELRTRQPGDRYAPLGMQGHSQKLSDFMINNKVPRRARDFWPLLCGGGLVIWVPGHHPADMHRLGKSSLRVIHCAMRHPPV